MRLPSQIRLNESRQNIKREDQGTFNLVAKSARYVETSLRVLQTIDEATRVTPKHPENLLLVQMAHINFLQDEYGALIVQGTCNKEVGKLFRAFRKNTSGLSGDAI